tara:strand:- start:3634 stop:4950 length:1317 start_codon:yes stop_codon:yes gene_type:complete
MNKKINVGILGLGTVGTAVAKILQDPKGRNPLISNICLSRAAVRNPNRIRDIDIPDQLITNNAYEVVDDPNIQVIVEVMGGLEPAKSLIMRAIKSGKSVVTANKALIARYGKEISEAAKSSGVYVLIEAAVGGGIPIIEPLKQSLGSNKINKISCVINGTTNYILTRMEKEGIAYEKVLKDAQELGYAEADPAADVEGLDAADKIAILSGLAFGGSINRENIPTKGINKIESRDVEYASELGYKVKLLAVAEKFKKLKREESSIPLSIWVQPTLVPLEHPLASIDGVNNAILIEGDPIGEVMFYGPGAGGGATASAVVADILNIAGISMVKGSNSSLDPLLAGNSWRNCHLIKGSDVFQKHYLRLKAKDEPGVIGKIGSAFGTHGVSIQSIVQLEANETDAEIVVITHEVVQEKIDYSLSTIQSMSEIRGISAQMVCI